MQMHEKGCNDVGRHVLTLVFILTSCITVVSGSMTELTPSSVDENEGVNITLTCTATGTNTLRASNWYKDNTSFGYVYYDKGGHCATSSIASVEGNFTYSCSTNETYSLTVLNATVLLHNTSWMCEQMLIRSNTAIIRIKVPVHKVNITSTCGSDVVLQEGISRNITSTTSYSRPRANVTWFLVQNRNAPTHKYRLNGSSSYYMQESGFPDFEATISTMTLNLHRKYNGYSLRCEADNGYTPVVGYVLLNVTYTTNSPTIEPTENGTHKVIHNQQGNITCSVNGGNPVGELHWNCSGTAEYYHIYNTTVSKRIVWTATQKEYCACTSTNIAGNTTSYVKIDVLYPVNVVNVEQDTKSALVLRENVSRNITCNTSYSRPRATIEWYVTDGNGTPKFVLNGSVSFYSPNKNNPDLESTVSTVSVLFNKTYNGWKLVCKALNIPNHTPVLGNVTLNITYPPLVNIPTDSEFVVNESALLNYTCPVEPGNPPTSIVTWNRSNSSQWWYSSKLLILNVSRQDDDEYTCSATNGLENSGGKYETSSGSIRLTVHFQTDVTDFYIRGFRHNTSVFVKEHKPLVFECRVQSNPVSAVRIYEMTTVVSSSTYAYELLYNTTALCHGGPVSYSCHGNNSLNTKPSTRHAQLFVRCQPRVDSNADVEFDVASAINQTATLNYKTLAYPHPSFVWYRNGSTINTRASRITILSTDLQTKLEITNVDESDFGEYSLIVTNDLGSINESFHLKPDGVPAVPSHFTQDNNNTTISSIALNWRSGFKNGSEQSFTIMYRKQTEEKYQHAAVQDTVPTGTTIYYNITGLSSGTSYDIVLFAVNAKGRSRYNATLTCSTKHIVVKDDTTDHSPIIGAAAGSAVVILLIGVVIAGVIIYRRRFIEQPQNSTIQPQISVTYENLKIDQIRNEPTEHHRETANHRTFETIVDNTYEELSRDDSGKEKEYTRLGNTSGDDMKTTYENLKIQL